MNAQLAAIALMPDDAEDWMVETAVGAAYEELMRRAAQDGAIIVGPLTLRVVRHEPVYDEDGNLTGYHDAVRLLVGCDWLEPEGDS